MLLSIPTIIYFSIVNIISAIVVIYDKAISKLPRGSIRRIPEKTFVQLSAIGGGFGTLGAMLVIRHKTKEHPALLTKIFLLCLLWCAIYLALFIL